MGLSHRAYQGEAQAGSLRPSVVIRIVPVAGVGLNLGGTESVEDQRHLVRRYAAAAVGDDDPCRGPGVAPDDRQLDDIVPVGMPDRVLDQRVKCQAKPFPVGAHRDGVQLPDPHLPGDGGPPAADMIRDQPVELNVLRVQERGVARCGDEQQPLGDPPQPVQLADDNADVLALLLACEVGREQLGVAECDRDRGPELVRGVLQELPLVG